MSNTSEHDDVSPAMYAAESTLTASRALLGVVARSVADALEVVTLPQFRVMVVLISSGPLRFGALAERVGALPSTFSRSVDRMEQGGWVKRTGNPDNGREVLIELTPHGHQLVTHVTERRRREMAAILAHLDHDERQLVARGLELFAEAAGEPAVEDLLTLGI